MPVVQIRPVRMRVLQRSMMVPVTVSRGERLTRMLVEVMAVVVAMAVRVFDRRVRVRVRVPAPEERSDRRNEQQQGGDVRRADRLAEYRDRNCGAGERRTRKDALRARGTELVSCAHVKHDADAVAEHARAQGACHDCR